MNRSRDTSRTWQINCQEYVQFLVLFSEQENVLQHLWGRNTLESSCKCIQGPFLFIFMFSLLEEPPSLFISEKGSLPQGYATLNNGMSCVCARIFYIQSFVQAYVWVCLDCNGCKYFTFFAFLFMSTIWFLQFFYLGFLIYAILHSCLIVLRMLSSNTQFCQQFSTPTEKCIENIMHYHCMQHITTKYHHMAKKW